MNKAKTKRLTHTGNAKCYPDGESPTSNAGWCLMDLEYLEAVTRQPWALGLGCLN